MSGKKRLLECLLVRNIKAIGDQNYQKVHCLFLHQPLTLSYI